MKICKKLNSIKKTDYGYLAELDKAYMKICFLTDSIVRIKVSFGDIADADKPEGSYVLQMTGWDDRLDFLFEDRKHVTPLKALLEEKENEICLKTDSLSLLLEKDPLAIKLVDKDGDVIYEGVKGSPFIKDANNRVTGYTRMNEDDCFYGFGEKTGPINKNKDFIRERATDCWSYDPEKCDTMYKHIPFYLRLDRQTRKATGLFYNNFHESVFNMGKEKSNYWPRYTYFQADGGDLDLFIFTGPSIKNVLDDYTALTGRPALLPKRALGYQGSSMYYSELEKDSDKALIEFVETVRRKGFPIDGFHLSSGYTSYDNKRCVFTWNKERFPDPKGYFAKMNELGAQNVPNVKPGILLMHPKFDEFKKEGVFVRDSENDKEPAVGSWWGGPGAFWDYTSPKGRELWKKYLTETVIDIGTNSIWDDNCEYDSLLDHDSKCDYDGEGGRIGEFKPVMCTIMSKLACEAVKEHDKSKRPYVVCRSGSSGIQKYAQNWVGDNCTAWRTLKHNIPTMLGVGLSGQPNTGCDIGGFAGPAPEEELFVRWVQHGIFQPRFSIHSASSDNTVTEPWMYSRQTDRIRNAILLRYRMLPHFYSLEYEAHVTGAPIMRPLVYEFQYDENVYEENFEFMLGKDLLVANVLEKGQIVKDIYLPEGCKWFDLENNFKCYEGGQVISIPVNINSIPRFLREGAILPTALNQPMNAEKDPVTDLSLTFVPYTDGKEHVSEYVYYDDDGCSNDFEDGVYRKTTITMSGSGIIDISFKGEGTYKDTVETVVATVVYKEKAPLWISFEENKLTHILDREKFEASDNCWYYSETLRAALIKFRNPKHDATLKVSFEEFDLIGM